MKNWLKLGDYNCICDSCGRKFKASTMRKRWDGLFVCQDDFEIKHPQLTLKTHADKQVVPIPRPDPPDQFLNGDLLVTESSDFVYGNFDYLLQEDGQYLYTEN